MARMLFGLCCPSRVTLVVIGLGHIELRFLELRKLLFFVATVLYEHQLLLAWWLFQSIPYHVRMLSRRFRPQSLAWFLRMLDILRVDQQL